MQLKMSKSFDIASIKTLLLQEDEFITKIFLNTTLPKDKLISDNHNGTSTRKKRYGPTDNILPDWIKRKPRARTFEELYAKLEGLKKSKKLGYKEKQLKKNVKTKIKKTSKRRDKSMQKGLIKTGDPATLPKIKKDDAEVPKVPRPKPVFNSEGKMVFSKFDFSEIGTKKKPPKKDPKRLLLEIKQKKEKLREMEQSSEVEKAQIIKEKNAWKSVLAKASGEKVLDDPDLIKQTLKRKEQKKKRSAKQWESRLENIQKGIRERQKKRQDNIMAKKKEKKLTKLKRAAKKGRVVAGF